MMSYVCMKLAVGLNVSRRGKLDDEICVHEVGSGVKVNRRRKLGVSYVCIKLAVGLKVNRHGKLGVELSVHEVCSGVKD